MFKAIKIGIVGLRPYFVGGHDANNEVRQVIRRYMCNVIENLRSSRPILGLTGLCIGVEQDFAKLCHDLNIDYYAYLPYSDQEQRWKYLPLETLKEYQFLLKNAIDYEILSEGNYSPHKNILKTKKIIEQSDHIIWVKNKKMTHINTVLSDLMSQSKVIHEFEI